MPEGNPGDVFLQHSGAVLDALLSNPAFAVPHGAAASAPGLAELPPSMAPDGAPTIPTPAPSPRSPTSVTEPGMPSASERINAILNRMTEPTRVVAPEVSTLTMPSPPSASTAPEAVPHASAPPPSSPVQQTVHRARTRLSKSPTLVLTLVGLATLIVIILVFTSCQPSTPSEPVVMATTTGQAAPTTAPAAPADGPIQVRSASSECPPGSTSAMDAFDGQEGKAWDCVRAYHVDGQILTIDLGKSYAVTSISIVPGWDHVDADGTDEWTKHRTAEKVSYQFDDDNQTTYTQETMNQRKEVTTKIDPPISATQIIVTILDSTGDPSLNDTAISSIVITGH